jgi:hypothetical protein
MSVNWLSSFRIATARTEESMFFSEEKNQKTFVILV